MCVFVQSAATTGADGCGCVRGGGCPIVRVEGRVGGRLQGSSVWPGKKECEREGELCREESLQSGRLVGVSPFTGSSPRGWFVLGLLPLPLLPRPSSIEPCPSASQPQPAHPQERTRVCAQPAQKRGTNPRCWPLGQPGQYTMMVASRRPRTHCRSPRRRPLASTPRRDVA